MNIKIILGILAVVIAVGGVLLVTTNKSNNHGNSVCTKMCQIANQACPSLINEDDCNNKCPKLSDESKKHLFESSSCEEIASRPDLIADLLIPEANIPKPVDNENASECEAACGSYVSKCLTLVPNATPALFEEGQTSCESECANWNTSKVNCMIGAFDCEAMTNVCGL